MKNIQIRQVQKFAQQLVTSDEESRRAAGCLANLARPGNSLVTNEALAVLLDALETSRPPFAKTIGSMGTGKPGDLCER